MAAAAASGISLERALARHCATLGACRACGDRVAGSLPILSDARNPRVMLVGQAPGQVEKSDRRAFAGRAGRTLFRWLADAGLTEDEVRERVYISAITRCYPGPSASGRGDRVPSLSEQKECGHWLDAELALIQPRLIIPVGRLAIDRFLGKVPLERVIGTEQRLEIGGLQTVVVPLPHPSGASSWVHGPGHADLLAKALGILRVRLDETLYL
jgi:uracil-DNA glycosylase